MTLDSSHIQNSHLGLGRAKPKFPGEDLIGSEGIRCHPGQHTYNLLGRITESDMNMATGTYLGCVYVCGGVSLLAGQVLQKTSAQYLRCQVEQGGGQSASLPCRQLLEKGGLEL